MAYGFRDDEYVFLKIPGAFPVLRDGPKKAGLCDGSPPVCEIGDQAEIRRLTCS